jgi:hypothetical protein
VPTLEDRCAAIQEQLRGLKVGEALKLLMGIVRKLNQFWMVWGDDAEPHYGVSETGC